MMQHILDRGYRCREQRLQKRDGPPKETASLCASRRDPSLNFRLLGGYLLDDLATRPPPTSRAPAPMVSSEAPPPVFGSSALAFGALALAFEAGAGAASALPSPAAAAWATSWVHVAATEGLKPACSRPCAISASFSSPSKTTTEF